METDQPEITVQTQELTISLVINRSKYLSTKPTNICAKLQLYFSTNQDSKIRGFLYGFQYCQLTLNVSLSIQLIRFIYCFVVGNSHSFRNLKSITDFLLFKEGLIISWKAPSPSMAWERELCFTLQVKRSLK